MEVLETLYYLAPACVFWQVLAVAGMQIFALLTPPEDDAARMASLSETQVVAGLSLRRLPVHNLQNDLGNRAEEDSR